MATDTVTQDQRRSGKAAAAKPKAVAAQTPADEVVTVLLDLLRRADQQVRPAELEGKAKQAAETYKRISLDLAVRKLS